MLIIIERRDTGIRVEIDGAVSPELGQKLRIVSEETVVSLSATASGNHRLLSERPKQDIDEPGFYGVVVIDTDNENPFTNVLFGDIAAASGDSLLTAYVKMAYAIGIVGTDMVMDGAQSNLNV